MLGKLELLEDMMPQDLVMYYFPTADDDDIDWILINKTCFPYGSIEKINYGIYVHYLETRILS